MELGCCREIADNLARVMVGKQAAIELLLVALLGDGHVLIEDVPGVGKTLLADEINRTVPRTQASLLESMAERQVTVDGVTQRLPEPFFVMATQNPIELEGTIPLPEAQLDRFLLKVRLGFPDNEEEIAIMERFQLRNPMDGLEAVTDPQQVRRVQRRRRSIRVARPVKQYIAELAAATRRDERLRFGSSPRGSLGLMCAAQALAAVRGCDYVLPDDVKYLARPVLAHRVILREEEMLRGATAEEVIADIVQRVAVPEGGPDPDSA